LWRFWFGFHQWFGDGAPTAIDRGRRISPATLSQPVAVLALTVAVILPNLGIGLIAPIRFPLLLEPHLTSAWITAIGLSSVARPTDEKHLHAVHRAAKQLSELHFAGHCSRARSGQWLLLMSS
jgi:hypothetical protein